MTFNFAYSLEIFPSLLRALGVTVVATILGMSLALALGLAWALLRRAGSPAVRWPLESFVQFIRSTPFLVQIYFLFYVLPGFGVSLSPMVTGVLALGLHYSTYTSEVYRAGIDAVPVGQWEASRALGLSPFATWAKIILPQAISPVLPALGNYLIAMFKDTPMLSAITVMELLNTAKVLGSDSFRYTEPLTIVGILFLAVSLICAWLIRRLEKTTFKVRHA